MVTLLRDTLMNTLVSINVYLSTHTFHICSFVLWGYGKSPDSEALKTDQNRVDLLSRFMESLGVRSAVLLSPSMSGHYSIPFLMKNNAQLQGFIPIAPVGTRSYTPQQYQNIQVREVNRWRLCVFIFSNTTDATIFPVRHSHCLFYVPSKYILFTI